jgi:hypothetical protein
MKKQTLTPTIRTVLKQILLEIEVGQERNYDPTNRNFITVRNTFWQLTKENGEMVKKSFSGKFTDDYSLFVITRLK